MTKLRLVETQYLWQKGPNHDHTLKMNTRSCSVEKKLTMNLGSTEHYYLFLQYIFGHYRYQ